MDERVEVRKASCSQDKKLSLKADEPQVGQRSKGKGNTTTLLFSLTGLKILHQERRGQENTMVMEHFKSTINQLNL